MLFTDMNISKLMIHSRRLREIHVGKWTMIPIRVNVPCSLFEVFVYTTIIHSVFLY